MLETQRLFLRPAVIEDASLLNELDSDSQSLPYSNQKPFTDLNSNRVHIRDAIIPQYSRYKMGRFIVFLKEGPFIGICGLRFYPLNREVDLGFRFLKKYWGLGHATESSKVCLNYGLKDLKLDRIIGKTLPDNHAAIKVFQKCGMTFSGFIKDPTDPVSFVHYEILSSTYKKCDESSPT